ncbi:MAG: type and secretion system protein [Bryobacterales bacterium]|nr:type and secretion system protein [Bryobacterales bacterium]
MPVIRVVAVAILIVGVQPAGARTRKGDRLIAQGRAAEERGELDKALEFDLGALSEDPSDPQYRLESQRVRFKVAEQHVKNGQKIRAQGNLAEALAEFQRAYAVDPSSPIAQQEIERTKQMIEREKRKAAQPGGPTAQDIEDKGLTPAQAEKKASLARMSSLQDVPELRPLNNQFTLKMNNQKPRVLFETVAKLAGINVLFDPEYEQQNTVRAQSIDLTNSSLDQALDYISLVTKSFWKPLSSNAIFVTLDNTTKRREFEEQVVKVFYLKNITQTTELQEVITTLRTVTDIQKIYNYSTQNALVVRCEADRMLLAEKIINDLDKPKNEVVVDVIVMEVRSDLVRNLGAQIAPGGINTNIAFTPTRASILGNTTTTTTTPSSTLGGTTTTPTTTTPTTPTSYAIPLNNLRKISSGDYSITGIPGGFIEALLSDSGTKVLQSPQLRSVDNQKVSLHIGDKVPTASGSFGSGIGGVGVGVSPLVQTQFTYIETGVNMDMQSKVHDAGQVSLHIEVDISQVTGYRDVGGIQQPTISQRKLIQDIRTEDGEINLLGGLIQQQDNKTKTGIPGISSIPLLNRLFNDEKTEKIHTELLITLIPHILRSPDPSAADLQGVASGNATNVRVIRGPRPQTPSANVQEPAPAVGNPPATAPVTPAPVPVTPAPITPAPVTPAPPAPAQPTPAPPAAQATPAPPAAQATASFLPGQLDAQLASPVSVMLRVQNVTDLNSVVAQFKFDPKILRINNVTSGDLIQQTGPPLTPSQNIMNDTGDATFSIARGPGGPGASGSGSLLTILFQPVGRGTTTVTVPQLTLKNTPGQPIATNAPALTVNIK